MAECDECGRYENLPYQCRRCGQTFCAEHRLPENHECPGLGDWDDPGGVFDSGFDDGVENRGRSGRDRVGDAVERVTGTGGFLGYFRGNAAYLFLALIWIVFLSQFVVGLALTGTLNPEAFFASETWRSIFVLSTQHPLYAWTWVTSMFAHSPFGFFHIAGNSIALYFFGPYVEKQLGSKRFVALFLVSGAIAGLAQIGTALALGETSLVLGASGAVMAVLGVLSILNPDMKVMLIIPPVPLPIWVLTLGYAALSVVGILAPFGGGIAHWAHLAGLVVGFAYGQHVKGDVRSINRVDIGRGGRNGRGPF